MPISFILDICHTSGIVTHGIRSPGDVQRTVPDDGKERSVIAGERNRADIYTMADGRRDGEWGNARAATGDGFGNWLHVVAGRSHVKKKK